MDLGHAVSYIFEDRKWVGKCVVMAVFVFLSCIPLLGLPVLILVAGYMMTIAKNVRQGLPRPLPKWDKWEEKFILGSHVLTAMVLYNLPLLIIWGCSWFIIGGLGGGVLGGGFSFFTACCALPFTLLYFVFGWSALATGVSEYLETGDARRMYRFVHVWDVTRANHRVLSKWGFYATLVNLGLFVMIFVPCFGWLIAALFVPLVHGHLFGQFMHLLSLTNNPKLKKRARA